jgi:hypothetical protein
MNSGHFTELVVFRRVASPFAVRCELAISDDAALVVIFSTGGNLVRDKLAFLALFRLQLRQGILNPGCQRRIRRFIQVLSILSCNFIVLAFSGERLRYDQV